MSTISQAFQQLQLSPWWDLHVSQHFGENSEKGADYNFGFFGAPVGSISSGRVIYVGNGGYPGSSIGQIVQVQSTDGSVVHYQHLQSSRVQVGQSVSIGDIVGTGGGCPVGAYGSGTSCSRTDSFSTGEHIEVRYSPTYNPASGVWGQNWVPPEQIFKNLAAGVAGTLTSGTSSGAQNDAAAGAALGSNLVAGVSSAGHKIGLFLLALVLAGFGFYLVFSKQIDAGAEKAAKVGIAFL